MRLPLLGLLAFLAACATSQPVATAPPRDLAPTAQACTVPFSKLKAAAANSHITMVELDHPKDFLRAFNAEPPTSDVVADQIFAIASEQDILVLFVKNDCMIGRGVLTALAFERLMTESES